MKLSIIIPLFNEEKNLLPLHKEITKVFENINYEIIFINDGSTDSSIKVLENIYSEDKKHVKVINFSRNFGKESAIYAGLSYSSASFTAIIDADLQQDSKYLLEGLNFLEENEEFDVVAFIPDKKKLSSKIFYRIINLLSDIKLKTSASDFRIFRANVKDAILSLKEVNRFSKGIFSFIGFNTKYMEYSLKKRKDGKARFGFRKKVSYAVDGITSFSVKPLKIVGFIGILITLLSFGYLIYIVISTITFGAKTPGFATLACLILFSTGMILSTLGLMGEYILRTFLESKKRPIYIERSKLGFDDEIL